MRHRKTCARAGCTNPLPPIAREHHDPYCSTGCARIERGLHPDNATPIEQPASGSSPSNEEPKQEVQPAAGMAALHHGTYDPSGE